MRIDDVRRIVLGTFVRPAEETGGEPRVEGVYGYLVRHEHGLVLLDTGIGAGDSDADAWYRPQRVPLPQALATAGVDLVDLELVANCHLHFDHCGGNPLLGSTPILTQRTELTTARAGDYTIDRLIDHPGSNYQEIDGETEVLPGLHVIPTPQHVTGHQSLVVECEDGSVVLAGQSHDTASAWTADVLAVRARALGHADPLPTAPEWVERLLAFDPRRVVFAHDAAVWEPVT
jgi:glyoxylase-like metal-dependent hydrolase (beta-lactamase superfamily II)